MFNPFAPAENDRSLQYLFQIFGSMGGVLGGGRADLSGSSVTILGTMFTTFNSIILGVGALILVYVTVMGVLKTAHEGEMMGKQWSSLWIPLRMVMGIASLVPTASGYSAIQIIMMWVIVQGIGAADMLWGTVLSYINLAGSVTANVTIPSVGIPRTIKGLYQGLVCDATFQQSQAIPNLPQGNYYCAATGDASYCNGTGAPAEFVANDSGTYSLGPSGACGTLSYCNEAALCSSQNTKTVSGATGSTSGMVKCQACKAQRDALEKIIEVLRPIASQLVATDYSYRNFSYNNDPAAPGIETPDWLQTYCRENKISPENCCVPDAGSGDKKCKAKTNPFESFALDKDGLPRNPPDKTVKDLYFPYSIASSVANVNFVQASAGLYLSTISDGVNKYISEQGSSGNRISTDSQLGKILQYAQRSGWVLAGTLYYVIGQQNSNNLKDANPTFSYALGSDLETGSFNSYRQNYAAAAALAEEVNANDSQTTQQGGEQAASWAGSGMADGKEAVDGAMDNASKAFTDSVFSSTTKSNPLVALQVAGYTMLLVATILFGVFLIVTIALGIGGFISPFAAGFGIVNPVGPAAMLVYMVFLPLFFGLLGILISLGGLLGVYVPLIPYVIFTLGVVGWFMSVIEAMVAGPLVALGILAPGGQSEILGKAEPALMLLFSLFLRPALMIFGLIASMLLAIVVVTMINNGFGLVLTSIASLGVNTSIAFDSQGNPYVEGGAAALAFNPLQLVLFLCAYVMLIVTALNKCFTLIHVVPEKVMRWIGGQGEQYGEGEGLREVKGGVEAGEGGAKSTAKGAEDRAKTREARADKKTPGSGGSGGASLK